MTRKERLITRVLSGAADQHIRFDELRGMLRDLGFDERIRSSHHIFTQTGVNEILNLQPRDGGLAKAYQVRQVRNVLVKYKLRIYLTTARDVRPPD